MNCASSRLEGLTSVANFSLGTHTLPANEKLDQGLHESQYLAKCRQFRIVSKDSGKRISIIVGMFVFDCENRIYVLQP
ncbi:hypothetical protein [Anabaena lutea]|uniref:Uncharacterized protein n=1 Tax=Anabaena lutea FACHB-196 TaxID=2692881 RepID=A0ABR8FKD2_9NOST|nr:hypothetical protein [Anabaena lutea]MBD2569647.1 hypothetical protein [Anabaena lutea FACHB-196]